MLLVTIDSGAEGNTVSPAAELRSIRRRRKKTAEGTPTVNGRAGAVLRPVGW